jgi:malonate decarboxylase delta subunit
METLNFRFENGRRRAAQQSAVALALHSRRSHSLPSHSLRSQLVGVVSSGNLEVLIEPVILNGACEVTVHTAALGFGAVWEAVMSDFHARWLLADTRISINDMGATPAVVSLRLDQAAESMLGTLS